MDFPKYNDYSVDEHLKHLQNNPQDLVQSYTDVVVDFEHAKKRSPEYVNHTLIFSNLISLVNHKLNKKQFNCKSNTTISIPKSDAKLYMDFVFYNQISLTEMLKIKTSKNPLALVQIVLAGIETEYTINKLECFLNLPYVKDYVMIFAGKPLVKVFQKKDNCLQSHNFDSLHDTLLIESTGLQIPLKTIYKHVDFK